MKEHDQKNTSITGDAEYGKDESGNGLFPEQRAILSIIAAHSQKDHVGQYDRTMEQILHEVNSFFDADHVLLWEISEEEQKPRLAHSYVKTGSDPSLPASLNETMPYVFGRVCDFTPQWVSRPEDLPPEARLDRQYMEISGIRSFMVVPLMAGGTLLGALSLACSRAEREWCNKDRFHFQQICLAISTQIDRKRSYYLLQQRMQFENLISDISARLMETPFQDVDREIERSLEEVRTFFVVERCALLGIRPDPRVVWVTHSSHAEGHESVPGDINLAELFPWSYGKLIIEGTHTTLTSIEELPVEAELERRSWIAMDIKSALAIPLFIEGKVSSIILLNTLLEERAWPEEYVPRLRVLGETILNALERRNIDHNLRESKKQLRARLQEIEQLKQALDRENTYLREEVSLLFEHNGLIGESNVMRSVLHQVEQVAPTDSTVLISGETGTGKELLAREIHCHSSRKERALVTVNCASLSPTLIESELFGREKGAYTGAMTRMLGRFEVADGSTIFLDEITELPFELQSKLLRVIEEGTLERLGSTRTIHVNVRLIAATNRDLLEEVERGAFRQDLFYRLNVFPITLPPLRERREDIPLLIWTFISRLEKKMGKRIEKVPQRSMEALQSYSWPGNVRELRNIIEHSMIMTVGGTLTVVPPVEREASDDEDGSFALESVERSHILAALQKCGWRISGPGGAAQALGLKRTTLQSKMKKLAIERPTR